MKVIVIVCDTEQCKHDIGRNSLKSSKWVWSEGMLMCKTKKEEMSKSKVWWFIGAIQYLSKKST